MSSIGFFGEEIVRCSTIIATEVTDLRLTALANRSLLLSVSTDLISHRLGRRGRLTVPVGEAREEVLEVVVEALEMEEAVVATLEPALEPTLVALGLVDEMLTIRVRETALVDVRDVLPILAGPSYPTSKKGFETSWDEETSFEKSLQEIWPAILRSVLAARQLGFGRQ